MTEIVTARVPAEIRRQGNDILEQLGATPSDLVRAAYDYVIAKEQLPGMEEDTVDGSAANRTLSERERQELLESIAQTSFDVPDSAWEAAALDSNYKELIARGRRADYEALA